MDKILKNYFPMIRTRQEVEAEIRKDPIMWRQFLAWKAEDREEFLDACTGVKGIKMIYDGFFKEVMNPEYAPERINDLMSRIMGEKVRLKEILPIDSTRISDVFG